MTILRGRTVGDLSGDRLEGGKDSGHPSLWTVSFLFSRVHTQTVPRRVAPKVLRQDEEHVLNSAPTHPSPDPVFTPHGYESPPWSTVRGETRCGGWRRASPQTQKSKHLWVYPPKTKT